MTIAKNNSLRLSYIYLRLVSKNGADTPPVRFASQYLTPGGGFSGDYLGQEWAALDFLEPQIQPGWLIPQFRHNLDGEREHEYPAREGQQQVFRVTFPGIRNSVRALIGKQADALARKFHETHAMAVTAELERLLKEYGELGKPWEFVAS
jgi:hypothetical protein